MEINKLSAQLDQKLRELEQRLQQLLAKRQQAANAEDQAKLDGDIRALQLIKAKLIKSRDIAWRAHQLQQNHQELESLQQKRQIGLALCILSAAGAIILLGIFLWM